VINLEFLAVALALFFIWLSLLSFLLYRSLAHYNRLTKGSKGNLTKILSDILDETIRTKDAIDKINSEIERIEKESLYHIQKVGLYRFNPFEDTGGNQSFILSILNGEDTGIVLTSLHSRGITRWYGKRVEGGQGIDHELSPDEKRAIKDGVNLKIK